LGDLEVPRGKILVICDEEDIRQTIGAALIGRGYEVILAASREREPSAACLDVIILDTDNSETDSIRACQELRSSVYAPIILLSSRHEETDVVLGLGVGADVYLTKPIRIPVLIAYVDSLVRRETLYTERQKCSGELHIQDLTLDLLGCELKRDGTTIPLSPTEFRLLHLLAKNAGRVLTRDQLLESVWEMRGEEIYSRTVDVHIGRLRKKLGDDLLHPHYIITVPGLGYKIPNR